MASSPSSWCERGSRSTPAPCLRSSRQLHHRFVLKFFEKVRSHKVLRFTGRGLIVAIVCVAAALVSALTIDLGPGLRGLAEREGSRFLKRLVHLEDRKSGVWG